MIRGLVGTLWLGCVHLWLYIVLNCHPDFNLCFHDLVVFTCDCTQSWTVTQTLTCAFMTCALVVFTCDCTQSWTVTQTLTCAFMTCALPSLTWDPVEPVWCCKHHPDVCLFPDPVKPVFNTVNSPLMFVYFQTLLNPCLILYHYPGVCLFPDSVKPVFNTVNTTLVWVYFQILLNQHLIL